MKASSSARPAPALIQVDGLSVRYGDRSALDNVSFQVQAGELVGLLGPNGAGKTTTLSVLATLLRPDAGRACVGGYDAVREPARVRAVLVLVPTTWAMDAFNDLMIRRRTFEAALRPTAVMLAYGALYLCVGLTIFRRRLRS